MRENERKIGYYLQKARWECNKSQEYMSLELGIARKTVQNWEKGSSEPTISQFRAWFDVLGISPLPFMLNYLYKEDEVVKEDAENAKNRLIDILSDLSTDNIRQLLYILEGDHGSSPRALIQMAIAHIQTPMRDRVNQASFIFQNFKLSKELGELTDKNRPMPDEELFAKAIERGHQAVLKRANEYSILGLK